MIYCNRGHFPNFHDFSRFPCGQKSQVMRIRDLKNGIPVGVGKFPRDFRPYGMGFPVGNPACLRIPLLVYGTDNVNFWFFSARIYHTLVIILIIYEYYSIPSFCFVLSSSIFRSMTVLFCLRCSTLIIAQRAAQ